jgi:Predicted divalent heavy-metal cations transporter
VVGQLRGRRAIGRRPARYPSRSVDVAGAAGVFGTLLAGILLFFALEKLVLLRHCHTQECEVHGATAPLLFIGDGFHNFIDGAIICSAVMTSVPLGVSTAIAVAAHEIPQEVGDVAILLASGYSRGRALLLNVVSGVASIAGALLAFGAVQVIPGIRPTCWRCRRRA